MYEKKYVNYGKDLFYCLILEKKISEKYNFVKDQQKRSIRFIYY